jgi:5-dehydro-4-deoxyglucarate dehydratase
MHAKRTDRCQLTADLRRATLIPMLDLRTSMDGVLVFPVTPFHSDLSLDLDGLGGNLEFLRDAPVAAVVACGANGEFHSLDSHECAAVLRRTAEICRGVKPLVTGVGMSLAAARSQAALARDLGFDAVMIFPPYAPLWDESAVADYLEAVARATDLPVFLYQSASAVLSPATVARLAALPNVGGFKDEHGDVRHFRKIQLAAPKPLMWVNGRAEVMVPAYAPLGATSFTSGMANFMPEVSAEIYRAAVLGDYDLVLRILQDRIEPVYRIRERRPSTAPAVVKAALEFSGLSGGPVRPPLANLSAADREELFHFLGAHVESRCAART